ncbi:MAG: hypothetical protein WAO20_06025 [Acidobacteriota bacterium]
MRSKSRFPRGLVLVAALATGLGLTPNILGQEPADETVETVFPIVANLSYGESSNARYFDTLFTVFNGSATTETVVLSFYEDDGQPFQSGFFWNGSDLANSGQPFDVEPGRLLYVWANRAGFNGWARASAGRLVTVNAQVIVRNRDWADPLILTGLPHWYPPPLDSVLTTFRLTGMRPADKFVMAALAWGYDESSLALVNPSPEEAVQVTLYGLNIAGGVQGEATVSIPPLHRISLFLHEFGGLLGDPPQTMIGAARIESTGPIAVGTLLNLARDNVPINMPFSPVPTSTSTP